MPFTLFHYPFALAISKFDKRLNLPGLFVGAVIPDIEVPFLYLFFSGIVPDHFILHSLVGALTIGLLLSVIGVRYLYVPIMGKAFNLNHEDLAETCRVTPILVTSIIIGIISHLAVDILHHYYNPILWPWIDPFAIVGPVCSIAANVLGVDIISGYYFANIIINAIMASLFILIVVFTKENRWQRLWVGPH